MKIRSDCDPDYPVPLTSIIATISQKVPHLLSFPGGPTHPLVCCRWVDFIEILKGAVTVLLEPVEWFPFALSIASKLWDKVH